MSDRAMNDQASAQAMRDQAMSDQAAERAPRWPAVPAAYRNNASLSLTAPD
jgi:hypothetical protein